MATRIMRQKTKAVNIWMKFTVIQRRHGLWLPVHEYYQFKPRNCEPVPPRVTAPAAKTRYRCPGCERTYTEQQILEHRCLGGSQAWPKIMPTQFKQNMRWRPSSDFAPITYKDLK